MSSSSSITAICFCSLCAIAAVSAHEPTTKSMLPRRLETSFVNLYQPFTNVDASALIDKDVRAIFSKTTLGTQAALDQAKQIYTKGAYAASYATLQIDASSLVENVVSGTVVQGGAKNNNAMGFVMETAKAGNASSLQIQYTSDCYVGGLDTPVLDHCFAESSGDQTIQIGENGPEIAYTYNPLQDTRNALTLESMGKGSSSSITYASYYEYSGAYDYANQVIQAAFQGTQTSFPNNNTNMDFSKLDEEGRAATIRWGVVGMNVHSQVVELLHHATNMCTDDTAIHHWDEAVALYTGSITTFPGEEGYLLFTVAEMECTYFGTCSDGNMASVNEQIFAAFLDGKQMLKNKQCQELEETARQIKSLMTVPLVQRVLRHAYELDIQENKQPKTQGDAAAFMASLVPRLHTCQRSSAFMVGHDLAPGNGLRASFEVLKFNLERTYDCLGIRCEDVGGLLHIDPSTSGQEYYSGGEPCGYTLTEPSSPNSTATSSTQTGNSNKKTNSEKGHTLRIVTVVTLALLAATLVAAVIRYRSRKPAKTLELEHTAVNVDPVIFEEEEEEDITVSVEAGEIA